MNIDSSKPQLLKDLASLSARLSPMYEVGGAVRDRLLERETCDIDVAAHDPEKAARLMKRTLGTKTVAFNRERRATACYRIISANHPGIHLDLVHIQGESIENDLARRDFTINAMARPLGAEKDTEIIDPFGGREDLKQGIIRSTRPENIAQDPLRIMRAFRLSAQLDFGIEPRTRKIIRRHAASLLQSAPERIGAEMRIFLGCSHVSPRLREMDDLGVLEALLPEIRPMRGCTQPPFHHLDVLEHSFQAFEQCEEITANLGKYFEEQKENMRSILFSGSRLPWLKLSVLLHDVGKPQCRETGSDSRKITFYGHDKVGGEIGSCIADRIRLSAKERNYLSLLIDEHMHIFSLSRPEVKKSTLFRFLRRTGDDLIPILIMGMADSRATRGPARPAGEIKDFENRAKWLLREYFREFKTEIKDKTLLNGRDLLAMGFQQGPEIGRILKKARKAQDDGRITNRKEALEWAGKTASRKERLGCKDHVHD